MSRNKPHVIETKSRNYLRSKIDSFYENGDALFRELSERDYGVDAIIELFDNGIPSGKIALVQIKASENRIVPLKNSNYVSCKISSSSAKYANQNNIPVILIYAYIGNPSLFYFAKLQDIITDEQKRKINNQDSIAVRISADNMTTDDLEPLFELIRNSYRR